MGATRHSRRQKAAAVGAAEVDGVRATARRLGLPPSTLESWRKRGEFAQLRIEKREEVAADLWAVFQKGVRRIEELLPQTDDMAKVAVATGILYDKVALMSGQATARTETRDVTDALDDHEKAQLRAVLDEVLAATEKVSA